MIVSREVQPTDDELIVFWQHVALARLSSRPPRPVRLMVIAWSVALTSMVTIYLALLWALQAVGT